jgi:hypothetical protein
MGTRLYFCGLCGPPKSTLRTPWGSMDPRLRTYALECIGLKSQSISILVLSTYIDTMILVSKTYQKNRQYIFWDLQHWKEVQLLLFHFWFKIKNLGFKGCLKIPDSCKFREQIKKFKIRARNMYNLYND